MMKSKKIVLVFPRTSACDDWVVITANVPTLAYHVDGHFHSFYAGHSSEYFILAVAGGLAARN